MAKIERPGKDEYASFYQGYVERVPEDDILAELAGQPDELKAMVGELSDEQAKFRFAPGEWSIKEVVGHLIDAERTFAYRAFAISRDDTVVLPSMVQDDYVREGHFDDWPLEEMLDELTALRHANVIAFSHLTPEASLRSGDANGTPVSVRANLYILAGHVIYHFEDLTEKYLPGLAG